MKPPPSVTMTVPELDQFRRVAGGLRHLVKDMRVGADPETIARRLADYADTMIYLLDRAQDRRNVN